MTKQISEQARGWLAERFSGCTMKDMKGLAVALTCGWLAMTGATAAPSSAPDAFLDQPLPPGHVPHIFEDDLSRGTNLTYAPDWVNYKNYQERLDALKKVSPRKLVLPEGLEEFIADGDKNADWYKGTVLFFSERGGGPGYGKTYRTFLTSSFGEMGMNFHYDPASDSLISNFRWYRDDPRTAKDLAAYLLSHRPEAYRTLLLHSDGIGTYIRPSTKRYTDDPWIMAFDALLSKPENFPRAWKLRFVDDSRRYFFGILTNNFFAARMRDDKGTEHVLLIDDDPEPMFPGEGYITYYVFDLNGKFENGGNMCSGHRCGNVSAWLNTAGTELTLRGFFNDQQPIDTLFVLTDQGLVLKDPSKFDPGYSIGKVIYRTNAPGA